MHTSKIIVTLLRFFQISSMFKNLLAFMVNFFSSDPVCERISEMCSGNAKWKCRHFYDHLQKIGKIAQVKKKL